MDCPRCNQRNYQPDKACPVCQFSGETRLIEELGHLGWLLNEADIWQPDKRQSLSQLRQKYVDRKKKLEIDLGLRLPPFTRAEAWAAWPKLIQQETLLEQMDGWLGQGLLNPVAAQTIVDTTRQQVDQLRERMEGHLQTASPQTDFERLGVLDFLLETVEHLDQAKGFVSPEAGEQVRLPLLAEKERLEIKLGLRPEPTPEPPVEEAVVAPAIVEIPEPAPLLPTEGMEQKEEQPVVLIEPVMETPAMPAPARPSVPLHERLWQMLLSERTLQAILFLGIFLLFSAALSFVAWGWKDFSAPLRVAIPTGFTTIFFALGWYVRLKTPMYRSGIALSAIAALLIPIDFYTVYVNFHIPANYWPFFWFIASLTCLVAYAVATLMIRSQFFGYLVGAAAGSTVLALVSMGHQVFGLSLDWRTAALSGLCLGFTILATSLVRPGQQVGAPPIRSVFANPLRYLALFSVSILMLFAFGWRFSQRETYGTFHDALTLTWWFGSLVFGWNAFYYQKRRLGVLAAIALPVSIYLTQAALFNRLDLSPAWHAFGWAWLTPLYLTLGHIWLKRSDGSILHSHGRTATRLGFVLLIIATFWPFIDIAREASPAAATHAVLAGVIVLVVWLRGRPVYLYWASFYAFSATTLAMAEMGLTLAQLGVGWATLAIAHLVITFNLGTRFPSFITLVKPLVIVGYVMAALAIFPPLFPYQGGLLAYTLGNWLALTGWGARLAHLKQPGFGGEGYWRKSGFHWLTSFSLPLWLWVFLTNFDSLDAARSPALVVLAWLMVIVSYRLTQVVPIYRRPWYVAGLLVSVAAPVIAFAITPAGFAPASSLLLAGLLYFFDAAVNRQSLELSPGGMVTAWGYLLFLNRLQLSTGVISFGFGLLIAVYFLIGLGLERKKSPIFTRQFLSPLYLTGQFLTILLLIGIYIHPLNRIVLNVTWADQTRLWQAVAQFLLAAVYGLYAYHDHRERWAHLAAWLFVGGGSFVALTYSTLYGSSVAAEMALIAIAFVLIERGLYRKQLEPETAEGQSVFILFTWQLFKRPLLTAGWAVSAGVIGLSLLYNLLGYNFWGPGGGRAGQIWAVLALLLIMGLYALSARLFRQTRFIWLAAILSFAPWTILTDLGWSTFVPAQSNPGIYTLSWSLLAWVLFLGYLKLNRLRLWEYALPLKVTAHTLLLLIVGWSLTYVPFNSFFQASGLLFVGLLYFADAILHYHSIELAPGVLITAWGYSLLLSYLHLPFEGLGFALALLAAFYLSAGLLVERGRSSTFTHQFLAPLYLSAHGVTLSVLWRIYARPLNDLLVTLPWTDEMLLWGAASQFILGIVYGFYAWGTFKERWGHFAAWLFALSGGFIAITYSSGSGSSTAKIALAAIVFVLTERALYTLRRSPKLNKRKRAFIRLVWQLYHLPLLVTGWIISAGVIGLALLRNLLWLGGETRQIWAAIALLLIVALYALSARLFRQTRFLWLAAPLSFAPWTILTYLGWFTAYRPTLPGYAVSWAALAWLLLVVSLPLTRRNLNGYALPLKWVANILMPFSLLWGSVEIETSCFTFALAIGFYSLGAVLNHRQLKLSSKGEAGQKHGRMEEWKHKSMEDYQPSNLPTFQPSSLPAFQPSISVTWQTKFFYLALGLGPIWCAYLLAWLWPEAQIEPYGLMLLIFGPLGLLAGQWLYGFAPHQKVASGYAFPAYLTGYSSLAIGTLLVANEPALLALVFLFDALLMLVSARLFKQPLWVYLAVLLAPLSLWLALQASVIPFNRYGWWLIGLASIYLGLTWILRRLDLARFGMAPLTASMSLIALGLPPSSLDQTGALWGYGSAAFLYALTAFWLQQPLLLTPASGLAIIPYLIMVQRSPLSPDYYGLALFLGAVGVVALGWGLDRHFGPVKDFPWEEPATWLIALLTRFLAWWAFPLYIAGFGLAIVSPLFGRFEPMPTALNFLVMMPLFAWAIYRFRLRGWLVATAIAGHLAALFYLEAINWWAQADPGRAWLGFLPVTLIMAGVTLFIRHRRKEHLFDHKDKQASSWAQPLYIILILDISMGQLWSLRGTSAAALVTLVHALLIGILASSYLSPRLIYMGLSLSMIALGEWLIASNKPPQSFPVALSQLVFVYGLGGYGLAFLRASLDKKRELRPWLALWELPLQRFSIAVSLGILVLAGWLGAEVLLWSLRAFLGLSFRAFVEPVIVQMMVGVFGFLGLLYVAAAFTHQWPRLGYVAIGMLLTAWMLHVFYIQQWDDFRQIQWYALPVGSYLLGVAYLEWRQGNKRLGRWLDYATMILMLGSLFWQTLLFGWLYALLLGSEGLASLLWGSGRRLRRFLYAGMSGVVLATLGQLLNSLQSINQWIVFGIVGLCLVLVAIIVERKLEDIKAWHEILETWE